MLQFPPWKVILVLAIIVWGVLLALPNVVNMSGAPGWVPKKPVNLGLDLQGGVYLEMEIRPEEVIGGRLEVFARDVRTALARTDTLPPVHHLAEVRGRTMTIKLTGADAAGNFPIDDAIARINKVQWSARRRHCRRAHLRCAPRVRGHDCRHRSGELREPDDGRCAHEDRDDHPPPR